MDKNNCYIIYYLHIVTQWIRRGISYDQRNSKYNTTT